MEHQLGDTAHAIRLCQQAIGLDPEFGNPYNDIGAYLITLRQWDAAIPWLEKAIAAKRYQPRQFPHINLGRIYLAKNMPLRALSEFKRALRFAPGDREIQDIILAIRRSFG
jgi:Tfp pilus assembly protein PilF